MKPNFRLDAQNAEAVAEICQHFDGLPLTIKLAAARIKLLPPRAMVGRLNRRLEVLVGGTRDAPGRQKSLRGTHQWSYELLSKPERILFRRLGAFVGGCSLEAAESVCRERGGPQDWLRGLLELSIT